MIPDLSKQYPPRTERTRTGETILRGTLARNITSRRLKCHTAWWAARLRDSATTESRAFTMTSFDKIYCFYEIVFFFYAWQWFIICLFIYVKNVKIIGFFFWNLIVRLSNFIWIAVYYLHVRALGSVWRVIVWTSRRNRHVVYPFTRPTPAVRNSATYVDVYKWTLDGIDAYFGWRNGNGFNVCAARISIVPACVWVLFTRAWRFSWPEIDH